MPPLQLRGRSPLLKNGAKGPVLGAKYNLNSECKGDTDFVYDWRVRRSGNLLTPPWLTLRGYHALGCRALGCHALGYRAPG